MMAPRTYRGVVHILAIVFIALMATLTVTMVTITAANMSAGDNTRRDVAARLAAESGMQYLLREMRGLRLGPDATEGTYAADLADALGARLNPTGNLAGNTVTHDGDIVYVPSIPLPNSYFHATFNVINSPTCVMTVTGVAGGVTRRVAVSMNMVPKHSPAFDYGLATKGPLAIFGNAHIIGVNDPSEASILSATTSSPIAISLDGHATVDGDATVVEDPRYMVISGNPSLGGTSDPEEMADHVHAIAEVPQFPDVETETLAALATNVIDANTVIDNHNQVFSNVRIAAGTNPVFSSDTVFNGVVYIEPPNSVTFTAKTTINGVIVANGAGEDLVDCQIDFAGRVEAYGVENLPDTPQFAAVKEQGGTFVLAPGFGVKFAGNFSAINGTIAADRLTFTGTAEGTVKGAVIGLTIQPMSVGGNVDIRVDRSDTSIDPAGFKKTIGFDLVSATYVEPLGD